MGWREKLEKMSKNILKKFSDKKIHEIQKYFMTFLYFSKYSQFF